MSGTFELIPPAGQKTRRMSSVTASTDAITRGPTVVVPPKHLMAPSTASEVAEAMEIARREMEEGRSETSTPTTPPETIVTDKYAYAFDIDGVLIRGGDVIPEAIEAMKMLNGENEYGIKV